MPAPSVVINKTVFDKMRPTLEWAQLSNWIKGVGAEMTLTWAAYKKGADHRIPKFMLEMRVNEPKPSDTDVLCDFILRANNLMRPDGKGGIVVDQTHMKFSKIIANHEASQFLLDEYGIDNAILFTGSLGERVQPFVSSKHLVFDEKLVNKDGSLMIITMVVKGRVSSSATSSVFQIRRITIDLANTTVTENVSLGVFDNPDEEQAKADALQIATLQVESMLESGWKRDDSNAVGQFWEKGQKNLARQPEAQLPSEPPKAIPSIRHNAPIDLNETGLEGLESSVSDDKIHKVAFQNWYKGQLPNPEMLEQYVGTSNVDASAIASLFAGTDEAIRLVNQFDSSLLTNIAMIFNTSGSAFGVYVPALDEAIKNAKVKKELANMGYDIEDKADGSFVAKAKQDTPSDKPVQSVIDEMYNTIKLQGGNTIGINMQKIISATQSDASKSNLTDPEDIKDIGILHLGETIVHEAVHAKGSQSEGPSEQAEAAFVKWALPHINDRIKKRHEAKGYSGGFSPLQMGGTQTHAKTWYRSIKTAQFGAQFTLQNEQGQHPGENTLAPGAAMLAGGRNPLSIEKLLDFARNPEAAEGNDSLDTRLTKARYHRYHQDGKEKESLEERLQRDHNYFDGYKSTEKLMDAKRTKPLSFPIRTSGIAKKATFFGWFNNLDLPYEERVIDGDYADYTLWMDWGDEGHVKPVGRDPSPTSNPHRLPRYNPETDDGIYMFFVDPQLQISDWETNQRERALFNRSTLALSAGEQGESKEINPVFDTLDCISNCIKNKRIKATRLLASEDIIQNLAHWFKQDGLVTMKVTTPIAASTVQEPVFPIWVFSDPSEKEAVRHCERFFISLKEKKKPSPEDRKHFVNMCLPQEEQEGYVMDVVSNYSSKIGLGKKFCSASVKNGKVVITSPDKNFTTRAGVLAASACRAKHDYDPVTGVVSFSHSGSRFVFQP